MIICIFLTKLDVSCFAEISGHLSVMFSKHLSVFPIRKCRLYLPSIIACSIESGFIYSSVVKN